MPQRHSSDCSGVHHRSPFTVHHAAKRMLVKTVLPDFDAFVGSELGGNISRRQLRGGPRRLGQVPRSPLYRRGDRGRDDSKVATRWKLASPAFQGFLTFSRSMVSKRSLVAPRYPSRSPQVDVVRRECPTGRSEPLRRLRTNRCERSPGRLELNASRSEPSTLVQNRCHEL